MPRSQITESMSSVFEPLHKLFNHPGLRRFLLALRIPIVLVFVALWPWWVQPELLVAGILVSLAGELLQVWCFACIEKEKVLTIRGPYQLCRNPMYLARYLLILGFVIVAGSWLACVLYTVVYWFYMVNRVKREEPVLEKIFEQPYRDYCRDVNRFLPGIRRVDSQFWFFDWQIMLSNNGQWNFLAATLGWAYVLVMYYWVVN